MPADSAEPRFLIRRTGRLYVVLDRLVCYRQQAPASGRAEAEKLAARLERLCAQKETR